MGEKAIIGSNPVSEAEVQTYRKRQRGQSILNVSNGFWAGHAPQTAELHGTDCDMPASEMTLFR